MKPIITKVTIGILGAGTVATGIVFANASDTYGNHLNKQGRTLLSLSETSLWEKIKTNYDNDDGDLLIEIDGNKVEKNKLDIEKLKTWCSQNSSKKFIGTDDQNYQRVSAWCAEPKTIKDLIGSGRIALNDNDPSGTEKNNDETFWATKVRDYKNSEDNYLINEVSSPTEEGSVIAKTNLSDAGKLRKWCRVSKEKPFKHEEDSRYLKYIKWCTK